MSELDVSQVLIIFLIGLVNASLIHLFSKEDSKLSLIATIRSLVQLLLLGFILQLLFDNDSWLIKLLAMVLVIFNGSFTLKKRAKQSHESILTYFVIISLGVIPGLALAYFILDEQYFSKPFFFIPFTGMLVGNSLTGLTLGINGLYDDIKRSKQNIIYELSFNISSIEVSKSFFQRSLTTGLTPILNMMLIVGIVSIPGLMTGQLMSGISPFMSARYQYFLIIAIQSTIIICLLLYYSYFIIKLKKDKYFLVELVDGTT